jgi:hypothetical protein
VAGLCANNALLHINAVPDKTLNNSLFLVMKVPQEEIRPLSPHWEKAV